MSICEAKQRAYCQRHTVQLTKHLHPLYDDSSVLWVNSGIHTLVCNFCHLPWKVFLNSSLKQNRIIIFNICDQSSKVFSKTWLLRWTRIFNKYYQIIYSTFPYCLPSEYFRLVQFFPWYWKLNKDHFNKDHFEYTPCIFSQAVLDPHLSKHKDHRGCILFWC